MKRNFLLVLLLSTSILFSLNSCKKTEIQAPAIIRPNTGTTNAFPYINTLTASHWTKDEHGFYVSQFKDVLSPSYASGHTVKVYLLTDGKEQEINQLLIYMGGELWASVTSTDLDIVFRYVSDQPNPPFSFLTIKLVVE